MSMIVKNNISAKMTLNNLNKNSKVLSKSLEKVSSGMKINSAKDDASGYSISERMRSQIRALDQANRNTQNGSALLNTADGAIGSSLDILRTLKEKAINAANDTNNDEFDRRSIQKEVLQLLDQLDDNANVTYNGKILNDGQLAAIDSPETAVLKGLNSSWIKNSLSLIRDAYGLSFENSTATCREMDVVLTKTPANVNALAYVSVTPYSTGECAKLTLTVNMNYYNEINLQNPNGEKPGIMSMVNALDRTIAHEMTHAVMASNIKNFDSLPSWVIEGSAELIHGIEDTITDGPNLGDDYMGGFLKLRYLEANFSDAETGSAVKRLMDCLARNGADTAGQAAAVSAATHGKYTSFSDFESAVTALSGDELLSACAVNLSNDDSDAILGWNANKGAYRTPETTIADGGIYSGWTYPSSSSAYFGLDVTWPTDAAPADPSTMLKFHTGAKANNLTSVSIGDMRAKALGL